MIVIAACVAVATALLPPNCLLARRLLVDHATLRLLRRAASVVLASMLLRLHALRALHGVVPGLCFRAGRALLVALPFLSIQLDASRLGVAPRSLAFATPWPGMLRGALGGLLVLRFARRFGRARSPQWFVATRSSLLPDVLRALCILRLHLPAELSARAF